MSRPSRNRSQKQQDYDVIEMYSQWKPIFDKYDTDNDGQIPLDEIKQRLLVSNNQLFNDFPPSVINEILERADWDKNRYLSCDEFVRMVYAMELGAARPRFQRLVWLAARTVVPPTQRAATVRRYIEEYSCTPPPIFMLLITIIEAGIFIYYCVTMKEFSVSGPVPYDSVLIYNPCLRKEAWRFLTYMFIHAGAIHLFFNLAIQLVLGIPLEMVHKWWRVALVYLGGVIAGSLGASLSDPGTLLAGASGGVYALIAAHLANVIINFKEMDFGWIRLAALLLFGGVDIGVALYVRYALDRRTRTSYAAHVAGSLAGLMLGLISLRNLKVHSWELKLGYVVLVLYIVLMGGAVAFNIFYTDYFPAPGSEFCKLFL